MPVGIDYKDIFNKEKNKTNLLRDEELVLSELSLLLGISKGSLFFGNNIGLDLEKYLYLTNKVAAFNLMRSDLEEFFTKYRRAKLEKIDMRFNKEDSSVDIELTVSVQNKLLSLPLTLRT